MNNVYFDNAASTPMDPEVFEHMKPYFCEHVGNPSSTHAHGRNLRNAIEQARRTIAKHLNATPQEFFFTSGGTEADNTAILGAVKGYDLKHIITTPIEHHAVLHPVESLEKAGMKVTWLSVDSKGNIDLAELREALANNSRSLVSIMHANNELGTINDIHSIGELCKEFDAIFHSDTVQTMAHEKLDLQAINVHFVTASAHKFYGPKGVGFLYVRKGIKIPALIEGGSQENNRRAGTENPASIAGMAFSLDKCFANLEAKNEKLWALKNYMKAELETHFPGVTFNGEVAPGKSLPTVLNVSLPCGENDCMLLFNLDLMGISASGGSACTSGATVGSFVLKAIGASTGALKNSVRFSFGMQNTQEEVDFVIGKLKEIVSPQLA
ncbi:cysteine desulfurase family protein [Pontibacter sp. G13]|uniref:cysteine desulfurase family protein n=1 Tax=Pontibacter sp. G13 TaxID=3074898 RepID=UPI00288973A6|nr:cysteine desulfurase family protein [Pontibacter sp. G13]WNJ16762.1 cysteine desulfurase family protein [Pontibacter sp. G13]